MKYLGLSSFYFLICAIFGVIYPFLSLYLEDLEWSYANIGASGSIIFVASMTAPILFLFIKKSLPFSIPTQINTALLIASFLFLLLPFTVNVYLTLTLLYLCFFCLFGIIPYVETRAITALNKTIGGYGLARVWGSIGFMCASSALGWYFNKQGYSSLPFVIASLFFCCFLVTRFMSGKNQVEQMPESLGLTKNEYSFKNGILLLAIIYFLLNASHGPYYTFYSIYLQASDYSSTTTGTLWAIAICSEIGVFCIGKLLIERLSTKRLLCAALFITAIRWFITANFADSFELQVIAQLCHGFSFAAVHICALEQIRSNFPASQQNRYVALYSAICVAGGSALGSFIAGWHMETHASFVFQAIGFIALLSALFSVIALYKKDLS